MFMIQTLLYSFTTSLVSWIHVCVCVCDCSPYIIGTMNQSTSASVANLQLHHNFRWVLCSPHTEPVRGFLSRYLRRHLISTELHTGLRDNQLERVVSWLPTVLERVNKFLENQSSSDLTIGTHNVHSVLLHWTRLVLSRYTKKPNQYRIF